MVINDQEPVYVGPVNSEEPLYVGPDSSIPQSSAGTVFAEEAAHALPSALAIAGAGAVTGEAITHGAAIAASFVGSPLAGLAVEIVGGLATAVFAGMAASKLKDLGVEQVMGSDNFKAYMDDKAKRDAAHPYAAIAGGFAGSAPVFGVNFANIPRAGGFAKSLISSLKNSETRQAAITMLGTQEGKAELNNLVNISFGAGSQMSDEASRQIQQGEFKPLLLAEATLSGALLNNPHWMKELKGAPDVFTLSKNIDTVNRTSKLFQTQEGLENNVEEIASALEAEKAAPKNPVKEWIQKVIGSDKTMTVDSLIAHSELQGLKLRAEKIDDPVKLREELTKHIQEHAGRGHIVEDEATAGTLNKVHEDALKESKGKSSVFGRIEDRLYTTDRRFYTDDELKGLVGKGDLGLVIDQADLDKINNGTLTLDHLKKPEDRVKLFPDNQADENERLTAKLKIVLADPDMKDDIQYGPAVIARYTPAELKEVMGYSVPEGSLGADGKVSMRLNAYNTKEGKLVLSKNSRLTDFTEDFLEKLHKRKMGGTELGPKQKAYVEEARLELAKKIVDPATDPLLKARFPWSVPYHSPFDFLETSKVGTLL